MDKVKQTIDQPNNDIVVKDWHECKATGKCVNMQSNGSIDNPKG